MIHMKDSASNSKSSSPSEPLKSKKPINISNVRRGDDEQIPSVLTRYPPPGSTGLGAAPNRTKAERPRPERRRSCEESRGCPKGVVFPAKSPDKDPSGVNVAVNRGVPERFAGIFSEVRISDGVPYYFQTTSYSEIPPDDFFSTFGPFFGLGSYDRMVLERREEQKRGFGYVNMKQEYAGLPVVGSGISLTTLEGKVIRGSGRIIPNLYLEQPNFGKEEAFLVAKNIATKKWAAFNEEQVTVNGRLSFVPVKSTRITENWILAYHCMVDISGFGAIGTIDVDAKTGKILRVEELSKDWMAMDLSGTSLYDGIVSFMAESDIINSQSRLRSPYVVTKDVAFGTPPKKILTTMATL